MSSFAQEKCDAEVFSGADVRVTVGHWADVVVCVREMDGVQHEYSFGHAVDALSFLQYLTDCGFDVPASAGMCIRGRMLDVSA